MYPFNGEGFAPRNHWFVAAWSGQIGRQIQERFILDDPVVLYRTEDGRAIAAAGRCPHRQFPMGAGHLEHDNLVCGYHGIAFGPDGRCIRIPTQSHIPPRFRLRTYPLVERSGWLWIWMGDPAIADEALIPDLDMYGWSDPGFSSIPMHYNFVNGRYQLLNDNLLDLSHLAFLHSSSIGMNEVATTEDDVEIGDRTVRSKRVIKNAPASPSICRDFGNVMVDFSIDFTWHAPAIHVGVSTTSLTQDGHDDAGRILLDTVVYHAVTPATRTTCHYFFGRTVKSPKSDDDQSGQIAGIGRVLAEDVFATEEIERLIRGREVRDLLNRGDLAVSRGRALIQRMMDSEDRAA